MATEWRLDPMALFAMTASGKTIAPFVTARGIPKERLSPNRSILNCDERYFG
jgi:hypothetical protein